MKSFPLVLGPTHILCCIVFSLNRLTFHWTASYSSTTSDSNHGFPQKNLLWMHSLNHDFTEYMPVWLLSAKLETTWPDGWPRNYFHGFLFEYSSYHSSSSFVAPTWSTGHQWNASFHFTFLMLRQSVGLLGPGISPSQGLYLHTNTK
jgi:hypothetical protein